LSCFRVAQRIKKQSGLNVNKKKLIQSWRYKTLAVIKRHKNHLSLSSITRQSSTLISSLISTRSNYCLFESEDSIC